MTESCSDTSSFVSRSTRWAAEALLLVGFPDD